MSVKSDVFVSAAQEQSNAYASYSTPLIPPPASAPAQDDLASLQKNGDPSAQGHAVVNFSTANTCDSVTINTGDRQRLIPQLQTGWRPTSSQKLYKLLKSVENHRKTFIKTEKT